MELACELLYQRTMRPWRIQQDEHPYHITTRTNGRKFRLNPATYHIFIEVLREAVRRFAVHIHHCKLMDNHYHLIMQTTKENLSIAMQYINFQLALRINQLQNTSGHLWGQRFHATIIDSDAYQHMCVPYIYQNGVRAGLCKRASDDPRFSTFHFYANGTLIPFEVVADDFYLSLGDTPAARQKEFVRIVNGRLPQEQQRNIQRGLRSTFFGSREFIQRMQQRYASHLHPHRRTN